MSDPRRYWVGFNLVKGIGAVRLGNLLEFFGNPEIAWNAPASALREAGLGPKVIENFLQVRKSVSLESVWERIQSQGITVLTWDDEGYPRRLKEIQQTPPVLYVRGEIIPDDDWAVAIVGTRRVTPYGRQVAEELGAMLGRSGLTIVSGLARGVDAIAHRACLDAGGRTLAVLGCGVDRIYPPEHHRLAARVIENGALISDYAPGTPPEGVNFPPRNRIIAGLSLATVVVEAGKRSGALITANFAVEQGRDVFAVPGGINAPQSAGTNRLIQQGAHPLLDHRDVLDVLDLTLVHEYRSARTVLPADPQEAKVFSVMGREPMHVDEIRNQAEMPIEEVTATLAMMELKGMVRQVGSMNYVAVKDPRQDYQTG